MAPTQQESLPTQLVPLSADPAAPLPHSPQLTGSPPCQPTGLFQQANDILQQEPGGT